MDLDLRRAARRAAPLDPETELVEVIRLARVDALDLRDRRLLTMLGVLDGEPEQGWLRGAIRSALRSDAGLGGVRETDLKAPVVTACVTVVRRTLLSWRREPRLYRELEAHLAHFEALAGAPLLPTRQRRGRKAEADLEEFLLQVQPEGRQRAGVLALQALFGAFSRSGRSHLRRALDYAEPFVSELRIHQAFVETFVRHALGRARWP
jgi:hypothetical protein